MEDEDFNIMEIEEDKPDKDKAVRQVLNKEKLSSFEMDQLLLD